MHKIGVYTLILPKAKILAVSFIDCKDANKNTYLKTKYWGSENICMPSFNIKKSRCFFYTVCSTSSLSQQKEHNLVKSVSEPSKVSHPAGRATQHLAWSSVELVYLCSASKQWRS